MNRLLGGSLAFPPRFIFILIYFLGISRECNQAKFNKFSSLSSRE